MGHFLTGTLGAPGKPDICSELSPASPNLPTVETAILFLESPVLCLVVKSTGPGVNLWGLLSKLLHQGGSFTSQGLSFVDSTSLQDCYEEMS
jgi:hypothetical protein